MQQGLINDGEGADMQICKGTMRSSCLTVVLPSSQYAPVDL